MVYNLPKLKNGAIIYQSLIKLVIEIFHHTYSTYVNFMKIYLFPMSFICFFKVTWRPVLWGMLLQLIFGVIVLRTQWGYDAFDWLGDRVTEYLKHTDAGSKFVFGDNFMEHFFAFQVQSNKKNI